MAHVNGVNGSAGYVKPSTRLRQLLARPGKCIMCPGVYDGISARIAIETGFEAMYQSGAAVTASRLGLPDLAFASLDDFAKNGAMIANLDHTVPLIADADTGFGGPTSVARMVHTYDAARIAGFHIEDQVIMKRCGHLKGKEVVDRETWKARIRACVIGRDTVPGGSDIVIIARTDSMAVLGFDEAVQRLIEARELGADVGFLEAIGDEAQIKTAIKAIAPMPLLVNFVSLGHTPWYPLEQIASWGVKIAIYPGASSKTALQAFRSAFKLLKEETKDQVAELGMEPRGFFDVFGMEKQMALDAKAGGKAFANGA